MRFSRRNKRSCRAGNLLGVVGVERTGFVEGLLLGFCLQDSDDVWQNGVDCLDKGCVTQENNCQHKPPAPPPSSLAYSRSRSLSLPLSLSMPHESLTLAHSLTMIW
jgi:hypothetical protein